jgi:hypothetical protein
LLLLRLATVSVWTTKSAATTAKTQGQLETYCKNVALAIKKVLLPSQRLALFSAPPTTTHTGGHVSVQRSSPLGSSCVTTTTRRWCCGNLHHVHMFLYIIYIYKCI